MDYRAQVPLHIEYVSDFDKHDFSTSRFFEVNTLLEIKGVHCNICSSNEKNIVAISGLIAENENEAFEKASKLFNMIAVCLSLHINKADPNCHYGQARFAWLKKEVIIKPRDQRISDSIAIQSSTKLNTQDSQVIITNMSDSVELSFLMQAFYGALQPVDLRAKYYHAFTIIEYLENIYKDKVGTKRFTTDSVEHCAQSLINPLRERGCSDEDIKKALEIINGGLKRATIESRQEKLLLILNNIFDIKSVLYINENVNINAIKVREFIETRNKLFHGGSNIATLKNTLNVLILVCENILTKLCMLEVKLPKGKL
ncbi:hypothetical protein [Paenibacillus campi]|uniref:hypothetical protein n=1 Tax=Paenibacillus campi TaxID=3106031 RepID=UPI002AFF9970|nr:hypothetical protein [Paenibacillus sp. SGZ-1014]